MHPWHDVYIDEKLLAEACPVVIEVPNGSSVWSNPRSFDGPYANPS